MESQIKKIRKSLKLSTSELALRLGLSQSTVTRLENSEVKGTISINTLRKISEALGCKFHYELSIKLKRSDSKKYHGLKRSRKSITEKSLLSMKMKDEYRNQAAKMSPEQRILQACELSDFFRQLK